MDQTEARETKKKEQEALYEKELSEEYLCKIDTCKFFSTCTKIQVKGEKVKCINYIYILH